MARTKKRKSGSARTAAGTPPPAHELDEDRLLAELARADYAGRAAVHDAEDAVRRVVVAALRHTALRLCWMARRIDGGDELADVVMTVSAAVGSNHHEDARRRKSRASFA